MRSALSRCSSCPALAVFSFINLVLQTTESLRQRGDIGRGRCDSKAAPSPYRWAGVDQTNCSSVNSILLPFLCPPASSIFTPALQLNFGLRSRRMRLCQYSPVTISIWDGSIMCYRLLSHKDLSLFLSHSLYYFGLIYTHTHTLHWC